MDTENTDLQALQEEIRKLREELDGLRKAGKEGSSNSLEARDFARELQTELKKTIDTARDRGRDLLDQARDQGDKAVDQLEKKIEEYPLMSLFVVFLAGLLLGKLFERR